MTSAQMKWLLGAIAAGGLSALAIAWLCLSPLQVVGRSMEPILAEGDVVLLEQVRLWWRSPQRGEIIVFFHPERRRHRLIKRVVALEGDTVTIRRGKIYVNGKVFRRLPPEFRDTMPPLHVPPGHLFVLGDNLAHSADSRGGWLVPLEDVIAIAWCRFLPLFRFRLL